MPVDTNPGLATIGDIMASLRALTPATHPQYFAARQQGGQTLMYVPWSKAKLALDEFAPGWDYHIKEVGSVTGDIPEIRDGQGNIRKIARPGHSRVYVVAQIVIPTCEGSVTREALGFEDYSNDSWGDPFSNASSMALRRAAAMFDLAIDLYDKTQNQQNQQSQQYQQPNPSYQQPSYAQTSVPQAAGGAVAKHGQHKNKPLSDISIDLGWLDYMAGPKASAISAEDKAMYAAEATRRRGGGGGGGNPPPPPPAQYAGAPVGPVMANPAMTAASQGAPVAPQATTTASHSNGTRSNEEIKNLVVACAPGGITWEQIQARAQQEFGQVPKFLTIGEMGLLQLMLTKNKTKDEFIGTAAQHLAGNSDPKGWGPNELSLLAAMMS